MSLTEKLWAESLDWTITEHVETTDGHFELLRKSVVQIQSKWSFIRVGGSYV